MCCSGQTDEDKKIISYSNISNIKYAFWAKHIMIGIMGT